MPRKTRGGDGSFSRRAALLMIGGGGLMAVSGTGSFTQVEGDRRFSAQTVSDKQALLSIKLSDVYYNTRYVNETVLKLKNRTNNILDISVTSQRDFIEIEQIDDLKPGRWRHVDAEITEKLSFDGSVVLTISAESESVNITATRSVAVEAYTESNNNNNLQNCPVTPSVTVSVDDSAQTTVTNPGSLSEDIDGNVIISNGNDLDLTDNPTISITGDIKGSSTGNIKLQNDKIGGNIISSSGKNVKLSGDSAVDGYVKAGSGITINGKKNSNTIVSEYIEAGKLNQIQDGIVGGNVRVTGGGGKIQRSKIGGDVTTSSGNDVSIKNSIVCGTVISDGNAKIKNGSKVKSVKTTTSGKNIKIKNGSKVTQNITLKGSGTVKIKNKSVVNGDITANNGTVKVKATVKGDITAEKVTIGNNGTVEGEITEK